MGLQIRKTNFKLHNFYLFIIGITIFKIILMGLFSSDYQNKMFMPFVDVFLKNIGEINPYEYYYVNKLIPSFPYPPLMLIIESIGGLFGNLVPESMIFLKNVLFKIPNLIFDFWGLYFLIKLFPIRRKYIGVLYLERAYIAKAAQRSPALCNGLGITWRIINDSKTVTIGDSPSIGETTTALP